MEAEKFVVHARIDVHTLETWVEAGWLVPGQLEGGVHYSDVDLARAHLINDLTGLGVNEAGVPIVLDLVDQLHGLRRALHHALAAARSGQATGRQIP
jgi:chaperone modulatory protein CbpM